MTEAAIEKWCLNTARSVLVDPYLTSARYLAHLFLDTGLTATASGREYTTKLRCFPVTLKKQNRTIYAVNTAQLTNELSVNYSFHTLTLRNIPTIPP